MDINITVEHITQWDEYLKKRIEDMRINEFDHFMRLRSKTFLS